MKVELEPKGELYKAAEVLIKSMADYLDAYQTHTVKLPVTWLQTDDGQLIIHVEKEYRTEFKEFIARLE
jgi:hypothetical protein